MEQADRDKERYEKENGEYVATKGKEAEERAKEDLLVDQGDDDELDPMES